MDDENVVYNVVNTDGIFLGLNEEAVNFLLENGCWLQLTDIYEYGYGGSFGMLFWSNGDTETTTVVGSLYQEFVIPTIVYDWIPYSIEEDEEIKYLPLYKYSLSETNDVWVYEKVQNKRSKLYSALHLLYLEDEDGNKLFEWSDYDLERSELMLEYNMGW